MTYTSYGRVASKKMECRIREVFYRESCFDDDGAKMMKCGMRVVFLREGATGDKHVLVCELD